MTLIALLGVALTMPAQAAKHEISAEIGRGDIPSPLQPSFAEMEETLNNVSND